MGINQDRACRLLDRIGVLRHPCDLDLLVFFARHPRSMLASEDLAAFLGYGIRQVAASLDLLLGAGLVTRGQNPTRAARLYVFVEGGPNGGWLPELSRLASSREGRLAMIWALRQRASEGTGGPTARDDQGTPGPGPRPQPFMIRRIPDAVQQSAPGKRRKGGAE